ncbi:MAG TPA: radical SAM protein [Myxococcota bacterium]|nr:radical SAM protein [Myxococcota bacterium]
MTARKPLQNDLEPLLLSADLSAAGAEILINLALGSARMEDLENNAKLLPSEDLPKHLSLLTKRGLIRSELDNDGRFRLVEATELVSKLPGPAGERLALLARQAKLEFVGGMTINPAMPRSRLPNPFEAYRNALDARLPQVEIKVQTSCNIGCLYCFIRKDPRDTLDAVVVRAEIERARSGGVERLILTGGEPTLRKDLPELISQARKLGFVDVQLFTNGLVFAYADRLDACMRAGLTSVVLHVSSVDRQLYARLTGRDHLDTVKQAMRNLARYPQLEVAVVSVINRLNVHSLAETIDFFRDWQEKTRFAWFANEIPFCCVYSHAWDNRAKVLMPIEKALAVLEKIIKDHEGEAWPLLFYGIPYCLLPGLESNSYDLYFTMARQLLTEKTFDYTFLDAMFLKPDRCRSCRHEPYCLGLSRGYARLYGSDTLQPVK